MILPERGTIFAVIWSRDYPNGYERIPPRIVLINFANRIQVRLK